MASNITNAAVFGTANMKPDPGEQADALWAQKIAENTGYLFYRRYQGPTITYSHPNNTPHHPTGTYYFQKQTGLEYLHGSGFAFISSNTNGIEVNFKCDATTIFTRTGNGTIFKFGTSVPISHLTNGSFYELTFDVDAITNTGSCMLNLTTWQAP